MLFVVSTIKISEQREYIMNDFTMDDKEMTADMMMRIKQYENDFIRLICSRLGIVINDYQRNDMNKAILQSCRKFSCTPENYLNMLMSCRDDSPLLEQLISSITIGETYFFRDAHQMQLLREIALPSIIKTKREQNNLSLRIWSAGCASGEEIYTLAIMLCESMPDIKKWNLTLFGSDISMTALHKAMNGVYSEWSMRAIPKQYKERYFFYKNNKYHLASQIKDLVTFSYLNLHSDNFPSILNNTNAQDLILCRNVLIYFDKNHIEQLMKKLDASLTPEGFILLGASDPINISKTTLVSYPHEGALLTHTKLKKEIKTPDTFLKPSLPLTVKPAVKNIKPVTPKQPPGNPEVFITKLLNDNAWQEALDAINNYQGHAVNSVFFLNAKAAALANLGQLELACKTCQQSLANDPVNPHTHFTLAMILLEQNHFSEAETALRKVLFLDPQFVAGHFQLGLLLIRNEQKNEGIKSLKNALTITLSQAPSTSVEGFKNINYGHLAEILKREIDLYSSS
jgi:chemotaxis protein methyltransferase CheR